MNYRFGEMKMISIAHVRQSDQQIQTIEDHLIEVKDLAEKSGAKIGIKHLTGLAGVLHDLGKYSNEFRQYIQEAVQNPDAPPKRGSVDHSTAGGKLLYKLFHGENKTSAYKAIMAEIVGNAILSHHSYLQDFLTPELESGYLRRVRDKEIQEFEQTVQQFFKRIMGENEFNDYIDKASTELESFLNRETQENYEKQFMFLTKYIFSALIDADRTNTRLFEENDSDYHTNYSELFEDYYTKLMKKINAFQNQQDATNPINVLRSKMSEQCERFAEKGSGIYTLSIPTGGGKTLASLRYALKHAKLHNKKRIIYVVPYTTIIEQNANEIREILGDNAHILEHHSNVIDDADDNDENQDGTMSKQQKLKLAKDNWDSPIIFTTMVQFLNVFYAKGSRNIRRLHNLSESIIIFDEVQKVPVKCVSLFNHALNFLKDQCHSSMLLCTATQPALDFVENKLKINTDAEIIKDIDQVVDAFKRVEIIDKATDIEFTNEKLTEWIEEKSQEVQSILVILNTKTVVKDLYQRLKESFNHVPIYHLSTSMCAAHRNDILEKVRIELEQGNPVICLSTQLIEAGVDVSFDCVIRSLAGLDSIAQAAGRCNRHGKKELQYVYVIDHEEEKLQSLKEIEKGKKIAKKILIDMKRDPESHGGNILSKTAMDKYFKEYYTVFASDLNYSIPKLKMDMTELLTAPKSDYNYALAYRSKTGGWPPLFITNSYKTAAENFQVIENNTTSVLVPYIDGEEIITALNGYEKIEDLTSFLRKAQHYTINLYKYELDKLNAGNGLVSFFDGEILALTEGSYSKEFGLDLEGDSPLAENIF
jgi:CRISPR-associated endonuclease/helicase Cas3